MWSVVYSDEFKQWFQSLAEDEQNSVSHVLLLLEEHGPQLPRPYADVINGSRISNLKELRIQHRGHPIAPFLPLTPYDKRLYCAPATRPAMKSAFTGRWFHWQKPSMTDTCWR